jgi:hypothetical protein
MNGPAATYDEAARSAGLPLGSRLVERRLDNGLWIAAAEVPGTRMQRLVGAVGAGYLDEPDDCRGLAHLLEHALFLGSAHFPEAGELARWIGNRGGRYNAHTGESTTDIHLALAPDDTEEGLARLVDMLSRPRFETERIAHEVEVLDAEFRARLADPSLHRLAALGRLCREAHPARNCHAGNRLTLGGDTDELVARLATFHHQHYHAGRMALVMLGPLPLDTQLELLARHGTRLASGKTQPPERPWRWSEPEGVAWRPFPASGRTSSLELFWPLPDEQAVSHAEWLNSLAAKLADGRLAATLQAAVELDRFDVTLAPEGMGAALALCLAPAPDEETVQAMLATCRSALELAIAAPLPEPPTPLVDLDHWPRRHACQLAGTNDRRPPCSSLTPQENLLPWLAREQCRLLWRTPSAPGSWRTLKETGTVWCPQPLAEESARLPWRAAPALVLHGPNQGNSTPTPYRVQHNGSVTLWVGDPVRLADAPPASFCLGWPAPASHQAARLAQWRRNTLPLGQAAAASGMQLSCSGDLRGDWLVASGSAERLGSLVELTLACWPQQATQGVEAPPGGLLAQRMLAQLETSGGVSENVAEATPALGWIAGNMKAEAADAILSALSERLQHGQSPPTEAQERGRDTLHLPPQGSDHAVMLEIVAPDDTPRSRWLLRLLAQCHDAAFHEEIRQNRALGYVAAVRYREASGSPRLGYVVQSPHTDTDSLREAILSFLAQRGEALAHLDPSQLVRYQRGQLALAGPPETHAEAQARLWQALRRQAASAVPPSPWQPLPWEAEAQALAALHTDQLAGMARDLATGRLARRWWLHTPE